MLHGKGLWAYRRRELDRALQIAPRMGATHIIYKVGQGSRYYGGADEAVQRITDAGLIPFAWMWVLLDDPEGEARIVVRAFQDGFQGFVFDTEADRCRGRFEEAAQLGRFLPVAELDLARLYNCSFPNISHHRDLPYEQMNEFCKGGLMPMAYGTYFAPESTVPPAQQARRVIDEWTYGHHEYWSRRWGYCPPVYPVLAAYHDEYGHARMRTEEFQIWLYRLAVRRPTFFSVFAAAATNDDLLPLICACPLGKVTRRVSPGVKLEGVSPGAGFLNVRVAPSSEGLPITQVDDGAVLEALEPEEEVRAKVGRKDQWVHVRAPGGVDGYVAAWYLRLHEGIREVGARVEVVRPELGFLDVRPSRSTERPPIVQVGDGEILDALEPEEEVRGKVGQEDQWLRVLTAGGVEGYVAAWALRLHEEIIEAEIRVQVVRTEAGFLDLRPSPSTKRPPITQVDDGEVLEALEPEEEVWAKVGQDDQWLRVRSARGVEGYVAAWHLRIHEEIAEAEARVEVIGSDAGFLSLHAGPSAKRLPITQVDDGAVLEVLEPEEEARAKAGQKDQWLRVRTASGVEGYVAARRVRLHDETKGRELRVQVVSPGVGFVSIRPGPSAGHPAVAQADDGAMLEPLEPEEDVRGKVGQKDEWLRVRGASGVEGYVAARYLRVREEIAEPEVRVNVVSPEVGPLDVRVGPSVQQSAIAVVEDGAVLEALEPEEDVRLKVGQRDVWVRVRTPRGVEGYVAARHLRIREEIAEAEVQVEVISPEIGFLGVRPSPSTEQPPVSEVDDGEVLEALEPEEEVCAKVGQKDKWLRVRTESGVEGYVVAWCLRIHEQIRKASVRVEAVSPEAGGLDVRPGPSIERPAISKVGDGEVLSALEPEEEVCAKVGQKDEWLHVRTEGGVEGYVAAWNVRLWQQATETTTPIAHVVAHSAGGLNVRKGPGADTDAIWRVGDGTVLEVQDDAKKVEGKLSKDRWLRVCTPSLHEGYVSGLHVRSKRLADKRRPVNDEDLPRGECAWIFGIHGAGATSPVEFRFLFENKDKTGWVLFTEAIGADPHHGDGHDYTPWSDDGYGVIVRLNNRYEPGGTLPLRGRYGSFARSCARYLENSRGCHIWIIGNEPNNVREHPGGPKHPIEHITPRMYAEAFDLARLCIKEVQPEAIVVPAAVDPYNTSRWKLMHNRRYRPLEYFKEMLSYITDLDGIALHTCTHWMDVGLITKRTVFSDEFLHPGTSQEHYRDFQAYRSFAEAIPEKWRDRPIYITETNHRLALEHEPRNQRERGKVGWVNRNKGWVQAAYDEIHRWNSTPHAQQIHCLLLYRWTGDAWAMEHKGEIHEDFRKALDCDLRWRS